MGETDRAPTGAIKRASQVKLHLCTEESREEDEGMTDRR